MWESKLRKPITLNKRYQDKSKERIANDSIDTYMKNIDYRIKPLEELLITLPLIENCLKINEEKLNQQSKCLKLFQDLMDAQHFERQDIFAKFEAQNQQINYLNYLLVTTNSNKNDGNNFKDAYNFSEAKAIERRVIELENKLDSIDQRYSYVQSSSLFAQHEGFKPEIQFKNEIEQLTQKICAIDVNVKEKIYEFNGKIDSILTKTENLITEQLEDKGKKLVKCEISKFKDKFEKAINEWKDCIEREIKSSITKRDNSHFQTNTISYDCVADYSSKHLRKKETSKPTKQKKMMRSSKQKQISSVEVIKEKK